jgi:maltose alpha-D-glucosyltransferase/alpha-amylase
VITELVINHTSDQHPWFQAARRAPKGSPERDFYVWSDDPSCTGHAHHLHRHREVQLDLGPVAGSTTGTASSATSPTSTSTTPPCSRRWKTMEFWLDLGVDGFRLDAIPYLIERDGTSNENLRETHDVIKAIRAASTPIPGPPAAGRGQHVARGRARVLRRRRRVPHGLSTSR